MYRSVGFRFGCLVKADGAVIQKSGGIGNQDEKPPETSYLRDLEVGRFVSSKVPRLLMEPHLINVSVW